jgi:hypothetical protein
MGEERVIGRDRIGRKVSIFTYRDGGKIFYDLQTDGRILLTTRLAKKIAKELILFAGGAE